MAVFVAMTVVRVVTYAAEGLFTAERLWSVSERLVGLA